MSAVLFDSIPCPSCKAQNHLYWDGEESEMPNVMQYVCPSCSEEQRHRKSAKAYQVCRRSEDGWIPLSVTNK